MARQVLVELMQWQQKMNNSGRLRFSEINVLNFLELLATLNFHLFNAAESEELVILIVFAIQIRSLNESSEPSEWNARASTTSRNESFRVWSLFSKAIFSSRETWCFLCFSFLSNLDITSRSRSANPAQCCRLILPRRVFEVNLFIKCSNCDKNNFHRKKELKIREEEKKNLERRWRRFD